MIISRTPFRISLFGGGSDYPQWYREHGGSVLGCAINKYCYITLRRLPPFFPHRHRIVYSIVETVNDLADIQHPAVRNICKISISISASRSTTTVTFRPGPAWVRVHPSPSD
jgi:D-glycero-alpha-D-manno-heptose-7-phosphate kinase